MMISNLKIKQLVREAKHETISSLLVMINFVTFGSIIILFCMGLLFDLMQISTNGITASAMVGLLETLVPITAYTLAISLGVWGTSKLITKVGK